MLSQIASCVSLKELRILLKKLSTFSRKHAYYPRTQLVFRGTLLILSTFLITVLYAIGDREFLDMSCSLCRVVYTPG